MKSPFWLRINNNDNSNEKKKNTTTTAVITSPIHIQTSNEEQQSARKESLLSISSHKKREKKSKDDGNKKNDGNKRKEKEDKYQIDHCDSTSTSSEIQYQHKELNNDQSSLLISEEKDYCSEDGIYLLEGDQSSVSTSSSIESQRYSSYCIEMSNSNNNDGNNKTIQSSRMNHSSSSIQEGAMSEKEKECYEGDIAFQQAREWRSIHDEMLICLQTRNNKVVVGNKISSSSSKEPYHVYESSCGNMEILTTNLDFLEEIRDEPVSDDSSTNTTSSITSCLREPKIWNTSVLQSKLSTDSEYLFDLGEEYESLLTFQERTRKRSVKFTGCFEIRECPSVEAEHKPLLFYTTAEMHRFRQDYYREVDASIDGDRMNFFDRAMDSIDTFLCNHPCGNAYRTKEDCLVEA